MRTCVIYESLYGNTASVAESIAGALRPLGEVATMSAAETQTEAFANAELLVFGAPTHAHGLPPAGTRKQATRDRGAPASSRAGVHELLTALEITGGGNRRFAAAFDTRLGGPRWLTGAAAKSIARHLRAAGFELLVPPESFVVASSKGPMRAGELERAVAWGASLARRAAAAEGQAEYAAHART